MCRTLCIYRYLYTNGPIIYNPPTVIYMEVVFQCIWIVSKVCLAYSIVYHNTLQTFTMIIEHDFDVGTIEVMHSLSTVRTCFTEPINVGNKLCYICHSWKSSFSNDFLMQLLTVSCLYIVMNQCRNRSFTDCLHAVS